ALALPLVLLYTQQMFRAAAPRLFDSRLPTYYEGKLVTPEGHARMAALVLAPASAHPLAGVVGGAGAWSEGAAQHRQLVAAAANLSSWPQWLGVIGGLCGGMLSDCVLRRTGSRRWARNGVAIGSLLMCLAVYGLAWLMTDLHLFAALLAVGSFFFNFSSPCAYALTIDMGGKYLPVVFGFMNMIGNVGAWLFVSCIMWVVSLGGWELAFGLWASLHLWAILCWLFLDSERKIA
ncbi:MAG: hypothetical protein K2W96_27805, partial [Gemmataceae bacterium]|nr:hypothetical protein [Gemmataceae bacterium]